MSERMVQQPAAVNHQTTFSDLPEADIERSTFDRSHPYKSTFDAGRLVPCLVDEVYPGDTFRVKTTGFIRLATPLHPVMDNLQADIHYFFVRNGLVWDNWKYFLGERKNPNDDPGEFTIPKIRVRTNELADDAAIRYMGIPRTEYVATREINALPWRSLCLIFNEWYRRQDYGDWFDFAYDETIEDVTDVPVFPRYKRPMYITAALPWPQKGDPVYLPLGTTAPVTGLNFPPEFENQANATTGKLQLESGEGNTVNFEGGGGAATFPNDLRWWVTALATDLTQATAATVNDIRTAFQIQRLLERDARAGTREPEIILSHFLTQSADGRLQRPELIGQGTATINYTPVASTVATTDAPQGNLSAVGTGLVTAQFEHSFTEHGHIIGIISVRTDPHFQNGLERFWLRETRYDLYWPSLAHLGEQSIYKAEVSIEGDPANDKDSWGFIGRYDELRTKRGLVTGRMASNADGSLDSWHYFIDLQDVPPLNNFFLLEGPPIDRTIAVPSEPHFILDMWHDMKCERPLPVYNVPGLIDHF